MTGVLQKGRWIELRHLPEHEDFGKSTYEIPQRPCLTPLEMSYGGKQPFHIG